MPTAAKLESPSLRSVGARRALRQTARIRDKAPQSCSDSGTPRTCPAVPNHGAQRRRLAFVLPTGQNPPSVPCLAGCPPQQPRPGPVHESHCKLPFLTLTIRTIWSFSVWCANLSCNVRVRLCSMARVSLPLGCVHRTAWRGHPVRRGRPVRKDDRPFPGGLGSRGSVPAQVAADLRCRGKSASSLLAW